MLYTPGAVPPGTLIWALAAPFVTVPEVTGVPMPATLNVTVPSLTVPPLLVTVADRVTFCAEALEATVTDVAWVVVAATGPLLVSENDGAEATPATVRVTL